MDLADVFRKGCQKHHERPTSVICTQESCTQRLLCYECFKDHDSSHGLYIKDITDLTFYNVEDECFHAKQMVNCYTI